MSVGHRQGGVVTREGEPRAGGHRAEAGRGRVGVVQDRRGRGCSQGCHCVTGQEGHGLHVACGL